MPASASGGCGVAGIGGNRGDVLFCQTCGRLDTKRTSVLSVGGKTAGRLQT